MTLTEFKSLSDTLKADAEFLDHPEVRRVYWEVVEPGRKFQHGWMFDKDTVLKYYCVRDGCGAILELTPDEYNAAIKGIADLTFGTFLHCLNETRRGCSMPDPIPGSLADAVEMMRAKVAERWDDEVIRYRACLAAKALGWYGASDKLEAMIVKASLRDRWMLFAAAAGALEV